MLTPPSSARAATEVTAHRFAANPIITPQMFEVAGVAAEGSNINGPSLLRVPDWAENRLGRYYLYFGHHNGGSIRLTYADELSGPWTLYQPERGVLRLNPDKTLALGEQNIEIYRHIASPDVHLDEANKRFTLYFHGPTRVNGQRASDQKSFVATSADGLDFNGHIETLVLGRSYFRVWEWRGTLYAFGNRATLYRAPNAGQPARRLPPDSTREDAWEENRGNPIREQLQAQWGNEVQARHLAVKCEGDLLTVFFSALGHAPERILMTMIQLTDDWQEWRASEIREVLRPAAAYEGVEFPNEPSKTGPQERVQQLRDPAYFRDEDGKEYLVYSVAGECGLAIAQLEFSR